MVHSSIRLDTNSAVDAVVNGSPLKSVGGVVESIVIQELHQNNSTTPSQIVELLRSPATERRLPAFIKASLVLLDGRSASDRAAMKALWNYFLVVQQSLPHRGARPYCLHSLLTDAMASDWDRYAATIALHVSKRAEPDPLPPYRLHRVRILIEQLCERTGGEWGGNGYGTLILEAAEKLSAKVESITRETLLGEEYLGGYDFAVEAFTGIKLTSLLLEAENTKIPIQKWVADCGAVQNFFQLARTPVNKRQSLLALLPSPARLDPVNPSSSATKVRMGEFLSLTGATQS